MSLKSSLPWLGAEQETPRDFHLSERVSLPGLVTQGWQEVQQQVPGLLPRAIEGWLRAERDRRIAQRRQAGEKVYRWGDTVRKCWQTLWGRPEQVRVPRLRWEQRRKLRRQFWHLWDALDLHELRGTGRDASPSAGASGPRRWSRSSGRNCPGAGLFPLPGGLAPPLRHDESGRRLFQALANISKPLPRLPRRSPHGARAGLLPAGRRGHSSLRSSHDPEHPQPPFQQNRWTVPGIRKAWEMRTLLAHSLDLPVSLPAAISETRKVSEACRCHGAGV